MNKKRNKVKVIIFFILLTFVISGLIINKVSQISAGWYNVSWLYRRALTVTGDGLSHTNEDVLIIVDTASLIAANKLQSDCDDLRFTDSDQVTGISHWIEGGCNSSSTQIWVRIPSVPTSGMTIYMYYGNSSATNAAVSWSGNFYLFSNQTDCGTGWTRDANFDNKFPLGSSSTFGVNNSTTHNHSYFEDVSDYADAGYYDLRNAQCYDPGGQSDSLPIEHGHQYTIYFSYEEIIPPYHSLLTCFSNNLVMTSKISMFDGASIPTGWTRYTNLDNLYLRTSSTAGTTGGSASHTHTYSSSNWRISLLPPPYFYEWDWESSKVLESSIDHYHQLTNFSISSTTVTPVYTNMLFATNNNSGQLAQVGMIIGTSSIPPLGWSNYTPLNGRFPRGSSAAGSQGGSASNHSHTISYTVGTVQNGVAVRRPCGTGGTMNRAASNHGHGTVSSVSTNTNSSYPSYRTMIYIKRNSSLATSVGTEELSTIPPNAPSALYTEATSNPIKVIDSTPEFSAVFTDTDTENTGDYYEIEVNSNNTFTGTVMWDSGKEAITSITNGARSSDISYGSVGSSETLTLNGATYYWRMKFWDNYDGESSWSSTANFTMSGPPNTPSDLLTDGQTNPLFLNSVTPTFSAIYSDVNNDNSSAYEIEVNTQSDFLGTSMWDTNKLSTTIASGNRSNNFTYAGTALPGTSNITYYWRIRFWDIDDNVSSWSSVNTFRDTLMHFYLNGLKLNGIRLD